MLRLASLLCLLLAANLSSAPANALPNRRAAVLSGSSVGICGVKNAGISPTLCIDFANGLYFKSGVKYASFTAMGGTLPSGCAIAGGTGLSCTTTRASIPSGVPVDHWMMVTNGAYSSSQSGGSEGAQIHDGTNGIASLSSPSLRNLFVAGGQGACASASNTGALIEDAAYTTGTLWTCSVAGNVTSSKSATSPAANTTLYIAGDRTNVNFVQSPFYVASVRIYPGTFTDVQVQTASTQ